MEAQKRTLSGATDQSSERKTVSDGYKVIGTL